MLKLIVFRLELFLRVLLHLLHNVPNLLKIFVEKLILVILFLSHQLLFQSLFLVVLFVWSTLSLHRLGLMFCTVAARFSCTVWCRFASGASEEGQTLPCLPLVLKTEWAFFFANRGGGCVYPSTRMSRSNFVQSGTQ